MKTLHGARLFVCAFLLGSALFLPSAAGLFAQSFTLSEFDFELKGLEGDGGSLGLAGTLKAGGAFSFGSHFNLLASAELSSNDLNLLASAELSSNNISSIFKINKAERATAELLVTQVAMEFPFGKGWSLVPVLFLGEYTDLASGELLAKTLKVKMRPPEFLRYGALSVFSAETCTQGLGGGLTWSAKKRPLALSAYGTWNGYIDTIGFNVYAQFAGTWRGLTWNIFGIFGRGVEDSSVELLVEDLFVAGGFSALVEGGKNASIYMQAKVLPFKLGSSNYFSENIENRVHILFEPRYRGRVFSAAAAFFLSPVLKEKYVPFLDLDDDALYAGTNISFEVGGLTSHGQGFGFNIALFADTNSINAGSADWSDILRICASPFYKIEGNIFTFTVSVFVNLSKITSPLSAGEINIHIEAAL